MYDLLEGLFKSGPDSEGEICGRMFDFLFSLEDAVNGKVNKSTANGIIQDLENLQPMAYKNFAAKAGEDEKLDNVAAKILSIGHERLLSYMMGE